MAHLLSFSGYHHLIAIHGLHSRGSVLSKTLSFWCSLRLLQVCSNLLAKTMRKGRNDPRNPPRNHAIEELQVHPFRCYHVPRHVLLLASLTWRSRRGAALAQRRQRT